jgi:hypothetical protein
MGGSVGTHRTYTGFIQDAVEHSRYRAFPVGAGDMDAAELLLRVAERFAQLPDVGQVLFVSAAALALIGG